MILQNGHSKQYLEDWKAGKIVQGVGLNCEMIDQYVKWKQGQVNFVLGLDNVGKTHFMLCCKLLHFLLCTRILSRKFAAFLSNNVF